MLEYRRISPIFDRLGDQQLPGPSQCLVPRQVVDFAVERAGRLGRAARRVNRFRLGHDGNKDRVMGAKEHSVACTQRLPGPSSSPAGDTER